MAQSENLGVARQIAAAWEASGVSVNCELCRHRDWNLVSTSAADCAGLPLWQIGDGHSGEIFLTYAVQCKKCGNVRFMSKARVEELAGSETSALR